MEFKRFVNTIIQMPCQIVHGGRRLVYRLLSWNEWQGVFLRWSLHCDLTRRRIGRVLDVPVHRGILSSAANRG